VARRDGDFRSCHQEKIRYASADPRYFAKVILYSPPMQLCARGGGGQHTPLDA
jgi:hypothetical protein